MNRESSGFVRGECQRLCTACDGDDPDCWRCGGEGIVPVAAIVPGDRVIVVHRYIPDDATFAMG
jgi:hypothetical protein